MLDIQSAGEARDTASAGSGSRPNRKVLYLIDTLLGIGGAEHALLKMVTHLPRFGYSAAIGSFQMTRDEKLRSLFPCTLYDFPLTRIYHWGALRTGLALHRLVARERFDVVHTIFPTADLWAAPIVRLAGHPLLVSGRRDMGILRTAVHDRAYRLVGRFYDQVQTVSEEVRRHTIEHDELAPGRVKTVYNGIDPEVISSAQPWPDLAASFGLDAGAPTVLTACGKIWPVKGVDVFVRAAARICSEIPRVNFLVAGWRDGDYSAKIETLANSLGVGDRFRFIGRSPKILSILKSCDVFCLLSRSEGMSNALLEAMACGLPSVATAVGGNPEVVEPERSGYLVPSEDWEAAAQRVLELLRDPAMRQRVGSAARRRVFELFTVEAMVRRVASLYDEALAERERPSIEGDREQTR